MTSESRDYFAIGVNWQRSPDPTVFEMFRAVLKRLSPPDMNPLEPGDPIRIAGDVREIPTLKHAYDVVPFTNESAGVRRIVTVAYLLVWAWNEHKVSSSLSKKAPQNRMVILIDEMEAHLHPKWQRVVLPAILDVTGILGSELEAQVIIATHSPLKSFIKARSSLQLPQFSVSAALNGLYLPMFPVLQRSNRQWLFKSDYQISAGRQRLH